MDALRLGRLGGHVEPAIEHLMGLVDALAVAFVALRVLYVLCYWTDRPTARSIVWAAALAETRALRVAVNQDLANWDTAIRDGDDGHQEPGPGQEGKVDVGPPGQCRSKPGVGSAVIVAEGRTGQ